MCSSDLMATSESTLLTVLVPIRDAPRLRERIREAVHDMLFRLQIPADLVDVQIYLARTPCGALKYHFPTDEVYRVFDIS